MQIFVSLRFRNNAVYIVCISTEYSVIFLPVHHLHSHPHQKQNQRQLFVASQPKKEFKQFLEKHQLQSLVKELYYCVVASSLQKQSAYYHCKMEFVQTLYVQKKQFSTAPQSSPHTSLWHADSITAHGSLQGMNTAFWDSSLSTTHTHSVLF